MDLAFGLDPSTDVSTYNYIQEYMTDPNSEAGIFWKVRRASLCASCSLAPERS